MNVPVTKPLARGLLLALIMAKLLATSAANPLENRSAADSKADQAVLLDLKELTESSGLAASNRQPGLFWSHNDSGGKPQLFAFDQAGKKTGVCRLSGAEAIDWEDMASFVFDGKAHLIVADSGDNLAQRDSISLYLLDEPDPNKTTKVTGFKELIVTFSDGPQDCEAIAVDSQRAQIILISKTNLTTASIYTIPLTAAVRSRRPTTNVTATRRGGLSLPMISAMDLHPASGDIWIVNYFTAFQFSCTDRRQPIWKQLAKLPKAIDLPRWKQIEAVAVDREHQVWVTSEGSPAPLGRLRIDKEK